MNSDGVVLLAPATISWDGVVATFQPGERVYDPEIIAHLNAVGAKFEALTASDADG